MLTLQDVKNGAKKINYNGSYSIYKITNIYTLNFYIGKSINIRKRLRQHISALEHNKNNKNFLYEFNLCKKDLSAYRFEILVETRNKDELDNLEKYYISKNSNNILFNIIHNKNSVNFEKEYPKESCWMDMLEPGYKSILTYYINWYKDMQLEGKFICKNVFKMLMDNGEKIENKINSLGFIKYLFSNRNGLIRLQVDYISISLINTLIKNSAYNLIYKIVDANMHKLSVKKIIANSFGFKEEINSINDLDKFFDWLLEKEILNDEEFSNMTLIDFTLYYVTYLYTKRFLIKQRF